MARASAKVMLFLICINVAATAWAASGTAGAVGVAPSPGGDTFVDDIQNDTEQFRAQGGGASFLVGLIVSGFTVIQGIVDFVFAGPIMFNNLGVPSWITAFVFGPMYLIVLLDLVYLLTGRDL